MMEASQDANLRVVGGVGIDGARGFGWRADEGVDLGGVQRYCVQSCPMLGDDVVDGE